MRAVALISKNGDKIVIQKEKLYSKLENDDITPEQFDKYIKEIEPEIYEKREFGFRITDVKSWSSDKNTTCIEFKDNTCTYVKTTKNLLERLRFEFSI